MRLVKFITTILFIVSVTVIGAEEQFLLGESFTGLSINGYSFGEGDTCIVVIGGIHGRYEGNTVEIAERLIDWCREIQDDLNISVKIIGNLNPDGFIYTVDDPEVKINGSLLRFNGNAVDLNRNWATPNWQQDIVYSQNDVRKGAGGKTAMSEPEVQYLSLFLQNCKISYKKLYVITLHSYVLNKHDIGDVFPSYIYNDQSEITVLEEANNLAKVFSETGNFELLNQFLYYSVPGEFLYWCGINNIAAIDIEVGDNGSIDILTGTNQRSHWGTFLEGFGKLLRFLNN